jgi:crotonobetainyl-CoA:carnitine CoA-transferase CaiB-like acyl-CoA transferase
VVSRLSDVARNEQLRVNGMIVELEHPVAGPIRVVGNPIKLAATPAAIGRPAPALGEHTLEVLQSLGCDAHTIESASSPSQREADGTSPS